MLVLTRKRSEMIQIGENVVIKIIQTGRGSVKIGIEAPTNVRVLRGELCEHPAEPSSNQPHLQTPALKSLSLADRLRMRAKALPVPTSFVEVELEAAVATD